MKRREAETSETLYLLTTRRLHSEEAMKPAICMEQITKAKTSLSAAERFSTALGLVPELAEVETVIRTAFSSDVAAMRDIPNYLLSLGGKRIRPALTLLCAKALGAEKITKDLINVAAGIELIHMATLMHDDIIDQSPIRRHKQSPYAKYGTAATLLSGDFLLTRAFGLCAKLDDEVISATELACLALVEGEALESQLHKERHTRDTSLVIAQRKTASLFTLAAFCAAHLTQSTPNVVASMSRFGEALGIAFQVIDDILDVLSDEETLGKRPGLDIAERKPSLINVLWLESGDPRASRLLETPDESTEHEYVEESLRHLRNSQIVQEAKAIALEYAATASQLLRDSFKEMSPQTTPAQDALFAVIDFAVDRVR